MSFDDLPENWPTLPLTDADHIANVLDLFVDARARHAGALLILICDDKRRPVQPVVIDDVDASALSESLQPLRHLASSIAHAASGACVMCAVARPGSLRVSANDQRWRRRLEEAFAGSVEVLGVHLVTTEGSRPIMDRSAA